MLLAGAVEVNALSQGALRSCTQWPWIKHPTFQLRGQQFSTEPSPPLYADTLTVAGWSKKGKGEFVR